MDSQKHIYEYVSSSGSYRVCTIRLSVAGYSSSGSHRACIIRLSVAGYSSSGSHRAYIIRLSVAGYSSYRFSFGLSASAEFVRRHCSSPFPSGGTCLPTNSPFTPAWGVLPVRFSSGMHPACRVSALWSAYLTRSRPCGSSSVRTPGHLLFPRSSDTSAGYASSGNGRPHS